jgi:hypothetical protein
VKPTVRFFRHDGVCRPMCCLFESLTRSAAFRSRPGQLSGRTGRYYALLIVATSPGRLFLSGLLASIARLRFTGTPILKPFGDRAQ